MKTLLTPKLSVAVLAFGIAFSTSRARAMDCPEIVGKIFASARDRVVATWANRKPKVSLEDLSKPLSQYVEAAPEAGAFARTQLSPQMKQQLFKDIDKYVATYRKSYGDFYYYKGFWKWWLANRDGLMNRPMVEKLAKDDVTVGELVNSMYTRYAKDKAAGWFQGLPARVKTKAKAMLRPAAIVAGVGAVIGGAIHLARDSVFFGPGVQIINSYLSPVTGPVSQIAGQRGQKDLSRPQQWIESLRHNGTEDAEKNLADAKRYLALCQRNLKEIEKLSPAMKKQRWKEMQIGFFRLYIRLNQALPQYLRDARTLKDNIAAWFINTASALSTFDIQRELYQQDVDKFDALAKTRELTPEEKQQRQHYVDEVAGAESRIAGALTNYNLLHLEYEEFRDIDPQLRQAVPMLNIYDVFDRSMRFDLYQQEIAAMKANLLQMGVAIDKMEAGIQEAKTSAK